MSTKDKKESIYRKALLALNMKYDAIMAEKKRYDSLSDSEKKNVEDPDLPIEVQYCDMFFESAVTYCASSRDWTFLTRHVYYDTGNYERPYGERLTYFDSVGQEIPYSYMGKDCCYEKPYDMLRPLLVDGKRNEEWAVDSDNIYFTHPVERLDYIVDGFSSMTDAPVVFHNLIAARLAIEIAPFIAPDSNIMQRCAQQYQLILSSLADIEKNNIRIKVPEAEEYITW